MTYSKSTNNKNCTFGAKIFPEPFFTEINQNQMLQVKIWHFLKPCHHFILKNTEVSFDHIHPQANCQFCIPRLETPKAVLPQCNQNSFKRSSIDYAKFIMGCWHSLTIGKFFNPAPPQGDQTSLLHICLQNAITII